MTRTVAIIQARMGSTRFPGKVLAPLRGKPMLAHVVERAGMAATVDLVVVALPYGSPDDPLAAWCQGAGVAYARGPGDDVLARYARAAREFAADYVLRITGDCPVLDPGFVEQIAREVREQDVLYASNVFPIRRFPDGLDVEAMPVEMLLLADRKARLPADREHVTPWIQRTLGPHGPVLGLPAGAEDLSRVRWTVDEPVDLAFLERLLFRAGPGVQPWRDLLEIHAEEIGARTPTDVGKKP